MSIRLFEIDLPLHRPLVTAAGQITSRRTVLVTVDGGWGEAAPFPGIDQESVDDVWTAFTNGNPLPATGAAALDAAIHDAAARAAHNTLAAVLGAQGPPPVLSAAIGVAGIDETLLAVADARRLGARAVKIKVASALDVATVSAVVATYGDMIVGADANESLASIDDALAFEAAGARYLEQPFAKADLARHRELRTRLGVMEVILDESIQSLADARVACEAAAADRLCLKTGRLGISDTLSVATLAHSHGIGIKIGGMFDSRVGRAIAASLAHLEGCRYDDIAPTGTYFSGDVDVDVDGEWGIGFTPDPTHLAVRTAEIDDPRERVTVHA